MGILWSEGGFGHGADRGRALALDDIGLTPYQLQTLLDNGCNLRTLRAGNGAGHTIHLGGKD